MVSGPSLPKSLLDEAHRAEDAARAAGLSFFDVVFEMLDAADVNAIAAYGGFPVRYTSWRFGMEFEQLSRGYDWGLSKIYELVINHDPTIAYLVRSNSVMEQKLVMAHVFGHADFFRNNAWFAPTDRKMLERFEDHARRMQEHSERVGQETVERFVDRALSLQSLLDPYEPIRRARAASQAAERARGTHGLAAGTGSPESLIERRRAAMDALMDPDGRGSAQGSNSATRLRTVPARSPFDVLPFLRDEAPVTAWQRDVLEIVTAEAEYFAPQRMTKIINEGWASFWHSRLLTGGLLDASEIVEFADCHSGATAAAPGQLNPYKLGIELFRHAEALGMDLFRLRAVHNDVSFIDEVFDAEFAVRAGYFVMDRGKAADQATIGSRDPGEVKQSLLAQLAWGGVPRIALVPAGDDGSGGSSSDGVLRLRHEHDGRDLKLDEAGEMLRTIEGVWGAPVELGTQEGEEPRRLLCEGGEIRLLEAASQVPVAAVPEQKTGN